MEGRDDCPYLSWLGIRMVWVGLRSGKVSSRRQLWGRRRIKPDRNWCTLKSLGIIQVRILYYFIFIICYYFSNSFNSVSFPVYHDFFSQFGDTKVFASQRPEGYGLKCHRAIRTICEVVGIKDLYCKVEGSTNVQHVVKAFFLGLLKQVSLWRR